MLGGRQAFACPAKQNVEILNLCAGSSIRAKPPNNCWLARATWANRAFSLRSTYKPLVAIVQHVGQRGAPSALQLQTVRAFALPRLSWHRRLSPREASVSQLNVPLTHHRGHRLTPAPRWAQRCPRARPPTPTTEAVAWESASMPIPPEVLMKCWEVADSLHRVRRKPTPLPPGTEGF